MKSSYGSYGTSVPGYGTSLVDRINLYLHFRRYFKLLRERWLLLLVFTSLGLGAGVWLAVTKPDEFESQAILVRSAKMQFTSGAAVEESGSSVDTTLALMKTEVVVNRVMAKLQENRDNTNALVRPTLDARAGRGNTFILKVNTTNFAYAQQFVTAWASEFVDFQKQQRRGMVSTTKAQTETQILLYERRLEQAQQALDDFRRRNNIASQQDAGASAQTQLNRVLAEQENLSTQLKLYENSNAELLASQGLSSGATGTRENPPSRRDRDDSEGRLENRDSATDAFTAGARYADIRKRIRGIEAEIETRSKDLKEKHPYMIEIRAELARWKQELTFELELVEEARKGRIETLKHQLRGYPDLIAEIRSQIFESADLRNQLLRLENDERNIQENLLGLKSNLESMGRVSPDEEDFAVVQAGTGDARPTGPDRPKLILTGAGIGFALAAAVMFLLHRLDDRLENPEEIEAKLEEPILGQLPEVDKRHNTEGYLLLTRMKPHTMFAESLRGVRSALLLGPEGASKRMLAVTSAVPGDGKTTFTTNFAATLAAAGNRTLLIDADLRRGNVHNYFEQPLEEGLAEVLDGRMQLDEVIRETQVPNLWLMRAGERPSNPSELLLGPRTKELIEKLRGRFDYVVFDCPPLTAIDDTFSIAAYLDGLLFVVRAGRTSIRFAKLAINTIRQRAAPLIGLVINGVPIDNPYYYYTTYYYASYYHKPLAPTDAVYAANRRGQAAISAAPAEKAAVVAAKDGKTDGDGKGAA
jgi:succinoglycan biosynthesis transport protein ExoP